MSASIARMAALGQRYTCHDRAPGVGLPSLRVAHRLGSIGEVCVALEHRWNPDARFVIFTAYFDESDTHGPEPAIIMAAYLE